jgi:predicted anti-sigma-YlaC factor YlaD
MMASCRRIRPLLRRSVEGEAGPDESLLIARHLSGCTGCRIVIARERRLAKLLDCLDDPLQVGDGFVHDVMSAIPDTPPAADRRRGLKLATVAGLIGVGAGVISRIATVGAAPGGGRGMLRFSYEGLEPLLETMGALAQAVPLALARLGSGLDSQGALLPVVVAALMIFMAAGLNGAAVRAQLNPRAFIRFFSAGIVRPSRFAADASSRSSVSNRRM